MFSLYPLKFKPVYHQKIWGGRLLESFYYRDLPPGKIGESWDVAAHPHGMSIVENGSLAGSSLEELCQLYGSRLLGEHVMALDLGKFPLLVKIIDANDNLSVQVHPDDQFARLHEFGELGKTEMWYVLAAEPGGKIVYGLAPGITKERFMTGIHEGKILECLQEVEVAEGDVFPIPAGLVHALGQGVMVVEVQQNSDTTYRVYDWDRLENGVPRKLHIEKALAVIDFDTQSQLEMVTGSQSGTARDNILVANEYFVVERIQIEEVTSPTYVEKRFHILINLTSPVQVTGNGVTIDLNPGESCLIPAEITTYKIQGHSTLLRAYVA